MKAFNNANIVKMFEGKLTIMKNIFCENWDILKFYL